MGENKVQNHKEKKYRNYKMIPTPWFPALPLIKINHLPPGYLDEVLKPLIVILPKISGYVKTFKDKGCK